MAFDPFKTKTYRNQQSGDIPDFPDFRDTSSGNAASDIDAILNQIAQSAIGSVFDDRKSSPVAPSPGDSHAGDSVSGLGDLMQLSDDGMLSPIQMASGGGGVASSSSSAKPPAPTIVGSAGGLQFNLIWDASVSSAPAAFMSDVVAAAQLYASEFSNREVINVQVGFGEVGGTRLPSGALAASMSNGYLTNYTTIYNALKQDASWSSYQATADASLTSADPTHGGRFFVTSAEAKALGLVSGTGTGIDGYIGLSSGSAFSYNQNSVGATQYDAIGAIEHELSEVMGRVGSVGSLFGSNIYTPLDLFRYSGASVRDLVAGPGYFSIDGGKTNLGTYNNPKNGGDASDWISTLVGDSCGFGYPGHSAVVSPTDLVEDAVLGYKMTATAIAATKTPGLA